jgi:hypothetical protein
MKVSLKTAFSLLDGRLSTSIDDVYEMLGFVFSQSLMTHQLPTAIRKLQEQNPTWFKEGVQLIDSIKKENKTEGFDDLMLIIEDQYSDHEVSLSTIDFTIPILAGLEKHILEQGGE